MAAPKRIVAVEIGAGNTKVCALIGGVVVKQLHFPSVVQAAPAGSLASFTAERQRTKVVKPVVAGVTYQVSLDADSILNGADRLSPGDEFQASYVHTALLAASLHACDIDEIDVLVLGTPVETFRKHQERLRSLRGELEYGLGTYRVAKTLVLPQPWGSLIAAITEGILPRQLSGSQLIVDVGYYSTDVLRVRDGLQIDPGYSFGLPSGCSNIYRRVAKEISGEIRKPVEGLTEINRCLRQRKPLSVYGQQISLERYRSIVEGEVDNIILELHGRSGSTEDVTHIVLTGGGAEMFEREVRRRFHGIPLIVMPDALTANARGYALAGEAAIA